MHKRGFESPLIRGLLALSIAAGAMATESQERPESVAVAGLSLDKAGIIEVLVGGPSHKPIANASVDVFTVRRDRRFGGVTDESGLTRIRVPPGEYQVTGVRREGYSHPTIQDEVISVEDGRTVRAECILRLSKASGVVRDEAGNPLSGVRLRVLPQGGDETTSDTSGRFEMSWDASRMTTTDAASVLVARDTARNLARAVDIDEQAGSLDVLLEPAVIVAGCVVDQEGRPLPRARIRVMLHGDRWRTPLGRDEVSTGSDGTFEAQTVPAGREYSVIAMADGYGKQDVLIDTSDLKDRRCDAGRFQLALADLSITGVVVDPNGEPVAGADVYGYGDGQSDRPGMEGIRTDAQGRFVMKGVCAGPMELGISTRGGMRLSGFARVEGGADDVKIVVSERPVEVQYVPRKPPSMKGGFLPPLTKLGISPSADAEGKMVLLCFWDMGQRPSRNCVMRLAARATQLTERGVTVVAVQAATSEGDALNRWIEENKIPFPVGQIGGDFDKTQFAWGVVSLPHLILTDKEHIVVAEGFSLADLDIQIEAATGR